MRRCLRSRVSGSLSPASLRRSTRRHRGTAVSLAAACLILATTAWPIASGESRLANELGVGVPPPARIELAALQVPMASQGPAPAESPGHAPQEPIPGSLAALAAWQPAHAPAEPVADPAPAREAVAELRGSVADDSGSPAAPVTVSDAPPPPVPVQRVASRRAAPSGLSNLVLGKWVPHREACGNPDDTEYLPLRLGQSTATAGDGACRFTSMARESATSWRVTAACSDGPESWTASVRLSVADGRLTWASERGTQNYVRCAPETRVAKLATRERFASTRSPAKASRLAARKMPAVRVTSGSGSPGTHKVAVIRLR